MNKLVIAGSASLQDRVVYWEKFWESHGYSVTASPREISREKYYEDYPAVHTGFYTALNDADIVFIMNEDKNGISGYIGAETFAELAYVVANGRLGKQQARVILLKMPESRVQSYEEINLWHRLGWIQLFDATKI
jgi:hypothetical protein